MWDNEGGLLLRGLAREGTALLLIHKIVERFAALTADAPSEEKDAAAASIAAALLGPHTVSCLATCKSKRKQQKLKNASNLALSALELLAQTGKKAGDAVTSALLTHAGSDFDARSHSHVLRKAMSAAGGEVSSQVLLDGVKLAVDNAVGQCREAVAAEGDAPGSRQAQCDAVLVKAAHSISNALLLAG